MLWQFSQGQWKNTLEIYPTIWHRCCPANGSLSVLTFWQSQKVVFSRKSSGKMMVSNISNPSCPSPACIPNLLHSQRYLEMWLTTPAWPEVLATQLSPMKSATRCQRFQLFPPYVSTTFEAPSDRLRCCNQPVTPVVTCCVPFGS